MYKTDKLIKRIETLIIMTVLLGMVLISCSVLPSDDGKGNTATALEITEVSSSNRYSFNAGELGSPDWIEIHNSGDTALDLSGYSIMKTESDSVMMDGLVLGPDQYAVLCACSPVYDTDLFCTGFRLSKEGTAVYVKNGDDIVIRLGIPGLSEDISWAKTDDGYRYCTTPTPGYANEGAFFEELPAAEKSSPPNGLVINEASDDFIEIYNGGESAFNLSMYCLSDDPSNPDKFQLKSTMLGSGQYYVVGLKGNSGFDAEADFGLGKDEDLFLFLKGNVVSSLKTSDCAYDMSIGLDKNGREVFYLDKTPGQDNSDRFYTKPVPSYMSESAPVHINELMLKNTMSLIDDDGDRSDWVELFNQSDSEIELKDYYLSDDREDLLKWKLPDEKIGPGEYMIIFLSGKDKERHTGFKVGKGESLVLTDMSSFSYEEVFFPDEERKINISFGKQDGVWKYFGKSTPGRENSTYGSDRSDNAEMLDRTGVYISEASATAAPRSVKLDWVELYNSGSRDISLDDLYISNDGNDLFKYKLHGTVPAGAYHLIYCTSKSVLQKETNANFGISTAGEDLYLVSGSGEILDHFSTGYLRNGVTSGRKTGDYTGERVFFTEPTPLGENSGEIGSYLEMPVFSVDGGWFEGPVELSMSCAEGEIRYTLDGSVPGRDSALYTEPLRLEKNTVVKAACFMDGRLSSDTAVSTYLFDAPHELPVVCLSIDPSDFRSVYSVSTRNQPVVERRCYFEYYENGLPSVSFPCGVRVSGNSTRTYAQKSLNVYLRGGYGQSDVDYPFFEEHDITAFKSLNLRNAGQDNYEGRIADIYASELMRRALDVDCAAGRFVVLYVNGSYYGLYDLKENQNEDWLASKYGCDPEHTCLIRRNVRALSGTNTGIKKVYDMSVSRSMSSDENYDNFIKYVDPDGWIDYIIAQSFCGNGDMFNQKLWYVDDFSVRVRPVFYDLDFAFGGSNASVLSNFFTGDGVPSPDGSLTNMHIPTALKKNSRWCEAFIKRCAEVLNGYLREGALDLYDRMVEEMRPEMKRHISRWHTPRSYDTWDSCIRNMRTIISNRPRALVRQMASVFGVSSSRINELFPWY